MAVGGQADFVKLDAAGNELAVLDGGDRSLGEAMPRIAYKLYHPSVASKRFGRDSLPIVERLSDLGYEQRLLTSSMGLVRNGREAMTLLGPEWYSVPVLAAHSRGLTT
jgi:hypothetical protein